MSSAREAREAHEAARPMREILIPLAALRAVEPAITIPERGEGRAAPGPAP